MGPVALIHDYKLQAERHGPDNSKKEAPRPRKDPTWLAVWLLLSMPPWTPVALSYHGVEMFSPQDGIFELHGESLPDDVVVAKYSIREGLSRPYHASVDFSSADPDFCVDACLRQGVALLVTGNSKDKRVLHGVVSRARFTKVVGKRHHFSLLIVPSLATLAHREDCRIFQDVSAPEIIQKLLTEAGLNESTHWTIEKTHRTREFTVQYRESTLNFIERLCEDEGFFYWFTHDSSGHFLHFSDALTSLDKESEAAQLSLGAAPDASVSPLGSFRRRKAIRTSEVALLDFDVRNPGVYPKARVPVDSPFSQPLFSYPGGFLKPDDGSLLATARLCSERHDADVVEGSCERCDLQAGGKIAVSGADEEELQGEFFLVETISSGSQYQNDDDELTQTCQVLFKGVPKQASYLPPRMASRPRIDGFQTAVVMGDSKADQSIYVDDLGRIKLHFHWDRLQAFDHNASCWIRVNQLPLGGSMVLPRVGWEVLVAFEEGDPDRPLVLGRVYNAEGMPPMSLPAAKASGSFSSKSSPDGAGSNEISFGDGGGGQTFALKAQKDLNQTTGYDQNEKVGVDDEAQVNENLSRSVVVDESLTVTGNQTTTVGAHRNCKVTGSYQHVVGGNEDANSTADYVEKVTADRAFTVSGNAMSLNNGERINAEQQVTRTVGSLELNCTASSMSDNIGTTLSSKVGGVRTHLVGGDHGEVVGGAKNVTIASGAVHQCGGDFTSSSEGAVARIIGTSRRKITGDLTIKAPKVKLNAGDGVFKGGSGEMKLAGGPITLKGSTIAIKAAMVKVASDKLKLG